MKNFQKVVKSMNEAVAKSTWDNKLVLKVEHTAFNPLHRVASGRNNVSRVLELQTVLTEANEIFFETESKSNTVNVYVNSNVAVVHGFGRYKGIFLRLKDSKGKYHSIATKNEWERKDIQVDYLMRVFGVDSLCSFEADSFTEYFENERAKVIGLLGVAVESEDPQWAQNQASDTLKHEYAKNLLQEIVNYDLGSDRMERFQKLCTHTGVSLIRMFRYVQRFTIYRTDFMNVSDKCIEIGWTQSNTYNSLPETLKITLVKDIKTVNLCDLGIESSGYYSHDDRMSIRADQIEEAKAFARRFKTAKNKCLTNTIGMA
jgi:hypothetical protein